jgi:hypothetical protein
MAVGVIGTRGDHGKIAGDRAFKEPIQFADQIAGGLLPSVRLFPCYPQIHTAVVRDG